MNNVEEIFKEFQKHLDEERETRQKIHEVVREIDVAGRQIFKIMQIIHQTSDKDKLSESIKKSHELLETTVKPAYGKLEDILLPVSIPPFYQYHDMWRNTTERLAFLTTLIVFLEDGSCALYEDIAGLLNMKCAGEKGLQLDLEDYLVGLLSLASELSRYAVNSVTQNNYHRPLEICQFVSELAAGFRLLTFKNDSLRKKYDGLKYDVKKIEEVVYDLSIRGLSPQDLQKRGKEVDQGQK